MTTTNNNENTQRHQHTTDSIPTGWVWCCEIAEHNATTGTDDCVVLMCSSRDEATRAGHNANTLPDMRCKHIGLYHEDTIRNGHYTLHNAPYRFYDVR